jgi:UDP-glucose 4-epimerase
MIPIMLALVTGGAGFIGSHSVERLLADGARVRVLDNFSAGRKDNLPTHANLEVCAGDVRNDKDVRAAMQGVTHVLHLAAQVSVQASINDPVNSCSTNILGFVTVLSAAHHHRITRVVYASSAAVYGIPSSLPLAENDPTQAISPYGLEKIVNERYAALFADLYGLRCLGLRYFNVYGPRQDPHSPYSGVISKFLGCIRNQQPVRVFGDGLQSRDFIHVADVADVNLRALKSEACGVCNVGTGTRVSLLQLIDTLSACLGKPLAVVHDPPQEGDIPHSQASVEHLGRSLGLSKSTDLRRGLSELITTA